MTVEYSIRCDACGELISTSRMSARAARADAELSHRANSNHKGDWCRSCITKNLKELSDAAKVQAESAPHSWGHWPCSPR